MSSEMVQASGADDARDGVRTAGEQAADLRKPYRAPRLIVYGSVRELTLGGQGNSPDAQNRRKPPKPTKPPKPSDPAVKQNILRIGTHPLGIGLYLFEYKPGFRVDDHHHRRHFGVMADEVEQVMPQAVSRDGNGIRHVDHALLGISDFAQQLED